MKKRLVFPATPEGQEHFRYLYDGVMFGAGIGGNARSKEMLRRDAAIQRQLRSISVETANSADRPTPARDLKFPEGGELLMDMADLEQIEKLIVSVPWNGRATIPVADLLDFLSAAPEVRED